jgi:phage gp46-like protein
MSQDILLKGTGTGLFDLQLGESDLQTVDGMETTIAVLLFTDARAASSEVIEPSKRRGWVGNLLAERELGGMLWLTEQVRHTQEVQNKIRSWAEDSLQPLKDEGLVSDIIVEVIQKTARLIELSVEIVAKDNHKKKYHYWLSTNLENLNYVG